MYVTGVPTTVSNGLSISILGEFERGVTQGRHRQRIEGIGSHFRVKGKTKDMIIQLPSTSISTVSRLPDANAFKPVKEREVECNTQMITKLEPKSLTTSVLSEAFGISIPIDQEINIATADLYADMKERESDFVAPQHYAPHASYLPYRRYLVDWMSDVGEQCRLHTTTIHVSILFLDKIFRSVEIPRAQWQLIATACISIAAKYEEAEECCPTIPGLIRLTKLNQLNHSSLTFRNHGELEVLGHLGWRLRAFPPMHIVNYFLAKGSIFKDDLWQGRPLIEKIPRYMKKYTEFFCNLTLQEYSFQQYLPSLLATAIIMAARACINVQPKWRSELTLLSGYEESTVLPVFDHVWAYFEEQFPGHGSRSISPKSVANVTCEE